MEHAFRRLLTAAFRHRIATVSIVSIVGVVATVRMTGVAFDSNVLNLLPQHGPALQAFRTYLTGFGSLDRLYISLQAPDGHTIAEYGPAVSRYLAALRELPALEEVHAGLDEAGRDWSYLLDRRLLLFDQAGAREALSRLTPPSLERALVDARNRLAVPSIEMQSMVRDDPLGWLALVRDRLRSQGLPLAWTSAGQGYVSADGRSRLVIARPVEPPQDVAFSRRLNRDLDAIAARTIAAPTDGTGEPLPPLSVEEAGGYRIAPEMESFVRRESIRNSVASFVMVTLLVVAVFRSARPLLLVLAPIVLAALVTIAGYGMFHRLSTAATGSSAMLFGLGVDGTLLLYVGYLAGRRRGLDAEGAVAGLGGPAVSLTIGFTTTAATFLGLVPLDFPALAELGRLIGLGILLCGVFTMLVVPALVPSRPGPSQLRRLDTPWLPVLVLRRRRAILAGAAVATIILAATAPGLRLVPTLDRLKTTTPGESVEADLAQRFGIPSDTVLVLATGPDLDALLRSQARLDAALRAAPAVPVSSPATFLPPEAQQAAVSAELAAALPLAKQIGPLLARTAATVDFRAGVFDAFTRHLPTLLNPSQRLTLEGYRAHGLSDLIGQYVQRAGDTYQTVSYVYPRSNAERARVADLVSRQGAPLQITGIGAVNAELARQFWPKFLRGAAIGTSAVLVLVFAGFRDPKLVALSLLPTGLSLLWTAGLLSLAHVELDLFSVFALLMSIGIAVDYGVHILHHSLRRGADGLTRALTEVAPAILLAGASTILGFGSLAFSSYRPLQMLGLVTVLTVSGSLVASLLVLPALLMGRRR